ncbi:MAG: DUF3014 domain-containing protein [Burkholderiaceae bacterium]
MNQDYDQNRRKGSMGMGIALLILAILVGAGYWYWQRLAQQVEPPVPAASEPVTVGPPPLAATPSTPAIEHPLPPSEPAVPDAPELPTLDHSDGPAREALAGAAGSRLVSEWLQNSELIRRVVVTVDNLPRESLPMSLRLVRPVPGAFATTGSGEEKLLAPANYARYTPLLKLAQAINPRTLAEAYIRFYPLFQQQYRALGYPDAYFNDALVRAIDNLNRTPDIREPIELVQPRVMYKFADPALENLSIGQRMMLRMGPDNVVLAKQILRAFRKEITGRAPKP